MVLYKGVINRSARRIGQKVYCLLIEEEHMKKLMLILIAAVMGVGIGMGTAYAADTPKQGSLGLSVDVRGSSVIEGRYFLTNDMAVLAGFGFGAKGGYGNGTDIGLDAGVRKYLKMDTVSPFVGGTISYSKTQNGNDKKTEALGLVGAEYFLHKQVSVEGSAGLGYSEKKENMGGMATRKTNLGTSRLGVSLNFYFF